MLRPELRFKGIVLGEPPGFTPLAVLHPRAFAPVSQDRRGFAVRGLRSWQSSVIQVCNGSQATEMGCPHHVCLAPDSDRTAGGPDAEARRSLPDCARSGTPPNWSMPRTQSGFPHRVRCIERVILGFGTSEKVKPYKARDFFQMTIARHPDLLECRTNIRTPRLSTTVCHGNPIQRSTGARSRTVLRSALTGKRVRPVCCLDYAVKPEVVLVARPPSRQGRRVTLQQSAKRRRQRGRQTMF
jgi:hypothetical protein